MSRTIKIEDQSFHVWVNFGKEHRHVILELTLTEGFLLNHQVMRELKTTLPISDRSFTVTVNDRQTLFALLFNDDEDWQQFIKSDFTDSIPAIISKSIIL